MSGKKGNSFFHQKNNFPLHFSSGILHPAMVYVTQVPHHRIEGKLVPSLNISPASAFGMIKIMFPPQTAFIDDTALLLSGLRADLRHYNFDNGDCLLPLGDPVVCAAAAAVLAARGRFRVLRWDKQLRRYIAATIDLS